MCIVIDTNTLSHVFNPRDDRHSEFKPVLQWFVNGKGFIVFGGTKYDTELKKSAKFVFVINELKKKRKVKEVDCAEVDEQQQIVEGLISDPDFDDPHIIAIFRVSRCKLLCSNDKRLDKHVQNRQYYLKGHPTPKIYRNVSHKDLLCDENIVKKLQPG